MAANDLISHVIMNNGDDKQLLEDLLILYTRQDQMWKLRDQARKSLIGAKHGTFSSVNMFLSKFESSEWGIHNITGSHAKFCPICKEKTFNDENITHCVKCKNVALREVGEIIFQSTTVGMELLAQTEEGKSHQIECFYLGEAFRFLYF